MPPLMSKVYPYLTTEVDDRYTYPAVLFGPKSRAFPAKLGVRALHGLRAPSLRVGIWHEQLENAHLFLPTIGPKLMAIYPLESLAPY